MSAVPQPWEAWEPDPISREQHMKLALEAEDAGMRLVTFTFVDAYPDPLGDGSMWFVEATVVSDWRTGEVLFVYGMEDEDPDLSGLFDVEHRLTATM